MSDKAKQLEIIKANHALICVVYGTNCNFHFKTDTWKVNYLKRTLKNIRWRYIGDVRKIKYYTFKDAKISTMRSCARNPRGWWSDNQDTLKLLERISATDYRC